MALIVIANEKSFLFFHLTFQAQQNLIGIGILSDEHSFAPECHPYSDREIE
jgi:hypothetical protein